MIIRIIKLRKKYEKRILFSDFTANINNGDIIGIFGENGSGKTTLLDLLAKKINPTDGKIIYEPQNIKVISFEQLSNDEVDSYSKETGSSGEIVKKRLEEIFQTPSDVYLFDEPTNHLDAGYIEILAQKIKKLGGIKIIASHDRKFLKLCANKIWDIDQNKITIYNSNFDKFIDKKSENRFEIEDTYSKVIRQITRLRTNDIKRQDKFSMMRKTKKADPVKFFRKKTKFLHQNKVYKKKVKRLLEEQLPKLPKDKQQLVIDFANSPIEDTFLLRVNNISKSFGKRKIFSKIDFEVLPHEKILITGENGAGKTTLLKILAGIEKDYTGEIESSKLLKHIQYFKQENFEDLNYSNTVSEELSKFVISEQLKSLGEDFDDERLNKLLENSNIHEEQILEHIETLGFQKSNLKQKVDDLSEGEKIKLRFAKILLLEPELLILDEPTNHLDIVNKLGIINGIKRYKGACVTVTHDTELIEAVEWDFNLKL